MARFSDEQIEAELVKLARGDGNPSVRAAAAAALGRFGEPSQQAKAALLSIIKNPPSMNPAETDQRKLAELHHWRDSADHAARSLARFGPSVIVDLIPLLAPLDAPTRLPAITALQNIGAPAVPRLIELLAHEDRSVAISAGAALSEIGQPAIAALAEAVSTGNEQVVDHAASSLGWIGPGAKAALPNLLAMVGSEQRSDLSRLVAARAVLKVDASTGRKSQVILSTIPLLIRILDNGKFLHQGWAAEILGDIGAPAREALPMLRKRLELPDQNADTDGLVRDYVRQLANEAIVAIQAGLSADSTKSP